MPTNASLEDLKRTQEELEALKMKNPEIYGDFQRLLRKNIRLGYRNFGKLLLGKTPEDIKGE